MTRLRTAALSRSDGLRNGQQRLSHDFSSSLPSCLGAETQFSAAKYRFKVLHGAVRLRVREIIRQVCAKMGVTIVHGVLSRDHVHMFVETRHMSGSATSCGAPRADHHAKSSRIEHIRKRYWGQRFWQRGYFSTTSGNITDDVILRYLEKHGRKNGFSPSA